MQNYKNQILDEPELPKTKKPNLKGLGIPLGFLVGVATNFTLLTLIDSIRFAANELVAFVIAICILVSASSILYLISSLYKFFSNKLLLLNGFLSQLAGMVIYMKIMEQQSWNQIFHKPHPKTP